MPETNTIPAKYVFLDVVGFTQNRSAEAQADIIAVLNDIVESSIAEHRIALDNVLFLPVGDGICIVLLNVESPYDVHLSVALSVIGKVYQYSAEIENRMRKFQVRVGVNSNTDNLITDINGHRNIAGAGINIAARIMRLADGNQILVSAPVFDALRYHEKYLSAFRSFRAQTKSKSELPVYQLVANQNKWLNISVPTAFAISAKSENLPVLSSATKPLPANSAETLKSPVLPNPTATNPTAINPPPRRAPEMLRVAHLAEITPPAPPAGLPKIDSSPMFLEQIVPPHRSRKFLWLGLFFVLIILAIVGWWMWKNGMFPAALENSSANFGNTVNSVSKL